MSGKIITIGEHHLELPPIPKRKEDILFINEKKENAYWRRLEFPKIWYDYNAATKIYQQDTVYDEEETLISLNYEDSDHLRRLLTQENKRRKNGVWMKNEEELTWIAPGYYYNLQWVQMKDLPRKFGDFREPQNQVMSVWHYVKHKWDWCNGLMIPKCKKSGITQIISGDFLNESTQQQGWEMGIMSKEYDHAVDVAMAYFFHGFDNLPYILQPDLTKRNEHEVKFGNPVPRIGAKAASARSKKDVLNSRVFCSKTKATGFDGPVMRLGWIDEMPKTWESSKISPDTIHKKVVETTKMQQRKNGALIYTSYMPEIDDKGYKEFRELCKQSRLSTRGASGKTQSSMILLPLTAVESNEDCFDKHGRCDKRKALFIINAENDSKKTESDKQAHRRQYPRDENDMFDSGGRGTTFDNGRLGVHQREVNEEIESGKRPWREGHLRWVNSLWETEGGERTRPLKKFCGVYMEELTDEQLIKGGEEGEGSIKIFHDLPDEMLNQVVFTNNRDEDGENLAPIDGGEIMVGSFDPTDYVLKRDIVDGSMFAGHGGLLYDPAIDTRFKKTITNTPIYEYHFRHDNPDDDLEMLIKIILYFGCRVIVEANKKWVVTALKREGLINFLLLKQKDGSIRPYKKGDENKLVNTSVDMINAYVRSLKRWFAPGGVDYMRTYKSPIGIQQCMDFDPNETKRYDLTVSLGYYRLANDSYSAYLLDEEENNNKYDGDGIEAAVTGLLDF